MLIVGITAVTITLVLFLTPSLGGRQKGDRKTRVRNSPNFFKGKFRNSVETDVNDKLGMKFKASLKFAVGGYNGSPKEELPIERPQREVFETEKGQAAVTWLGHAALIIEIDGLRLLTDPMFGMRASPFSWSGPKRFSKQLPIEPEELPDFDAIIISHDHYDHLDHRSIKRLKGKTRQWVVSLGVGAHLERWGIPADQITELDWNEKIELQQHKDEQLSGSLKITTTPSRHFSGRMGIDAFSTLWSAWVIEGSAHKLFFGADSGYFDGFAKIGAEHGPFDLAMLECGAYNEAWDTIHMFPEQTAQAAKDLKTKTLLPIHWGVFSLAPQPWFEPIERLTKAAEKTQLPLTTPKMGQRFFIPSAKADSTAASATSLPTEKWWRPFIPKQ